MWDKEGFIILLCFGSVNQNRIAPGACLANLSAKALVADALVAGRFPAPGAIVKHNPCHCGHITQELLLFFR